MWCNRKPFYNVVLQWEYHILLIRALFITRGLVSTKMKTSLIYNNFFKKNKFIQFLFSLVKIHFYYYLQGAFLYEPISCGYYDKSNGY